LPKGGEEIHKALDGETARGIAHQRGDMRLLDAQDFAGLGLRQIAPLDKAANLQRELGR